MDHGQDLKDCFMWSEWQWQELDGWICAVVCGVLKLRPCGALQICLLLLLLLCWCYNLMIYEPIWSDVEIAVDRSDVAWCANEKKYLQLDDDERRHFVTQLSDVFWHLHASRPVNVLTAPAGMPGMLGVGLVICCLNWRQIITCAVFTSFCLSLQSLRADEFSWLENDGW